MAALYLSLEFLKDSTAGMLTTVKRPQRSSALVSRNETVRMTVPSVPAVGVGPQE
jgi:hypothetical protein